MEGLAYCAKNSFEEAYVQFEPEPDTTLRAVVSLSEKTFQPATLFETIEIRHGIVGTGFPDLPEVPPSHQRTEQEAWKLRDFYFTPEQPLDEVVPQLKLIRIQSRYADGKPGSAGTLSLDIRKSLFHSLLSQMRANPWVLWLISSKYDGFHEMKAHHEHADTYFFGFFHSAIVWTFFPESACTKVMFFSRLSSNHEAFYTLLNTYTPHLFTPYVPLLAITIFTMLETDQRTDVHVGKIIEVEKGTGFSWVHKDVPDLSFDLDELARWSRVSANVQINMINRLRHHENCMRALEIVASRSFSEEPKLKYKSHYDKSMREIHDAVSVLKMRADSFVSYANYIKNRAEAQIGVIFSLLTHEDSLSNLKAAEASMEIAAASKRDSSAMKTIAVVTMAFLPATFLAAFFALPVVEWEQKTPVQMDGLQLYWIVAILSTVLVFVVWGLITQRSWLLSHVLTHRRGLRRGAGERRKTAELQLNALRQRSERPEPYRT